jgi:hypothetical protein
MSKTIESSIVIKASQEVIWEKITNFQDYNIWNPQISDMKGEFKVGGTICFNVVGQSKKMAVKAIMKNMDRPIFLCWQSGVKHVFHVRHEFIVTELSEDTARLVQKETYSGVALPFVERLSPELLKVTEDGFAKVNLKVKQDCELNRI